MTGTSREMIEGMFDHIRAKTKWPIDTGECLWGYFFVDTDRTKLEAAGRLLEAQGYRFVGVLGGETDAAEPDGTQPLLHLHVERVEHHSVDTLMAREEQLREFARNNGLDCYDGMDVGAAPTTGTH
jgi:hypothetical protein